MHPDFLIQKSLWYFRNGLKIILILGQIQYLFSLVLCSNMQRCLAKIMHVKKVYLVI